jgi:hypothetical protein
MRLRRAQGILGLLVVVLLVMLCFAAISLSEGMSQPSTSEADEQTLHFTSSPEPITNPLMGLAPWASLKNVQQPHTLVYAELIWRDFEPQRGVYDFHSFERTMQLDRWRSEHMRVVFRFVMDKPGKDAHLDIPDWLYKVIRGDGDEYDTEYGKGFSPDYSNLQLVKYHKEAIQALGDHYGKDGFFAYIELGSLGHWGEWHVKYDSAIRRLPEKEIRDQYVRHYLEFFPNTFLLMRRPFSIAKELNLGLYNDVTGEPEGTNEWLDWISLGGTYEQTEEPNELVAMPDAWSASPIGGEQTAGLSNEDLYGKYLDQTMQLLEQSHATFIGPNGPYDVQPGESIQSGVDRVLGRIGYRIYVSTVKMPLRIREGSDLNISISLANNGVAPIYYNWPAQVYVIDGGGNLRKTFQPELDLRKILPGQPISVSLSLPLDELEAGSYTVGLAILDPISQEPAVQLVMPNPRNDLVQELGTFEIKSVLGWLTR